MWSIYTILFLLHTSTELQPQSHRCRDLATAAKFMPSYVIFYGVLRSSDACYDRGQMPNGSGLVL